MEPPDHIRTDIAEIKTDIKYITSGIEELKQTCRSRDHDCDEKFCDLYDQHNRLARTVESHKTSIEQHEKRFGKVTGIVIGISGLMLSALAILVAWMKGV